MATEIEFSIIVPESPGQALGNLLEKKGESQSKLAREKGISPATISRARNGSRHLSGSLAWELAEALDAPPQEKIVFALLTAGIPPDTIGETLFEYTKDAVEAVTWDLELSERIVVEKPIESTEFNAVPQRKSEKIADVLNERITDGIYTESLPNNAVLAEEFNCSISTIYNAIRILRTNGEVTFSKRKRWVKRQDGEVKSTDEINASSGALFQK